MVQRRQGAWSAWAAQNAAFGNLWKATAEINEALYPHVQWGRDYLPHRLGRPGAVARALCGSHYVKEVRVPAKVYTYVVGMKYPMPGICGGRAGAPNQLTIRYEGRRPYVVAPHRRLGADGGRASGSATTTAAVAVGATRSTATRGRCSTTCSTSTCSVAGAADRDYGVVLDRARWQDLTLAVERRRHRGRCGPPRR